MTNQNQWSPQSLIGRVVLVVGGTQAAAQGGDFLHAHGALLRMIARRPSAEVFATAERAGTTVQQRPMQDQDFAGVSAAYVATRDQAEDLRVAAAAWARGIPVHVEGRPELSTLALPLTTPDANSDDTDGESSTEDEDCAQDRTLSRWRRLCTKLEEQVSARATLLTQHLLTALKGKTMDDRHQSSSSAVATAGTVYVMAVSADDPDLLTLRGHRLLHSADAVVFDRDGFSLSGPLLQEVRQTSDFVAVSADTANETVATLAHHGKAVVRLVLERATDPQKQTKSLRRDVQILREKGLSVHVLPSVVSAEPALAPEPSTEDSPSLRSTSVWEMAFPLPFSPAH